MEHKLVHDLGWNIYFGVFVRFSLGAQPVLDDTGLTFFVHCELKFLYAGWNKTMNNG
jgi:hypothetical protein